MPRLSPLTLPRSSFLLAGTALAVLIIQGFLWYGARQAPYAPYLPVHHQVCGEPVSLWAEDYNLLGSTRPGKGIELARLDFCDAVQVIHADGSATVWFWLEVEIVGQVFPYTGWGYPWRDVETPFPAADDREPRNPWWTRRDSLRALANQVGYPGGDGTTCPHEEANRRGVGLFFYREEGFQLPVGARHAGWVCVTFNPTAGLPDAFTVSIQPDRARITQWVDKVFVVREAEVYGAPELPTIDERAWCDYVRRTHPASVRPDGICDAGG